MKKLIHLDTCQPDYFAGFAGTVLIGFHWQGQTTLEAIDSVIRNTQTELHDAEIYEILENWKKENKIVWEYPIIDEKYLETEEGGDTGLVHYFGIIEE